MSIQYVSSCFSNFSLFQKLETVFHFHLILNKISSSAFFLRHLSSLFALQREQPHTLVHLLLTQIQRTFARQIAFKQRNEHPCGSGYLISKLFTKQSAALPLLLRILTVHPSPQCVPFRLRQCGAPTSPINLTTFSFICDQLNDYGYHYSTR